MCTNFLILPDVIDGSTAVQDKKAITTLAVIDDEPPMASQSSSRTCDVDRYFTDISLYSQSVTNKT